MADAELNALTALTAATMATSDLFYVEDVSAGTGSKLTAAELATYMEPFGNGFYGDQTGFTSDQYITGSDVLIPTGRIKVNSKYRCRIVLDKTAATGTTAPAFNIRIGTAGTTADTSRGAHTQSTQTGAIDAGAYEFTCGFSVAGAVAVLRSTSQLTHQLNVTGLGNQISPVRVATSAAFDVTGAGLKIGISVNAGASNAWTIRAVDAYLSNLV